MRHNLLRNHYACETADVLDRSTGENNAVPISEKSIIFVDEYTCVAAGIDNLDPKMRASYYMTLHEFAKDQLAELYPLICDPLPTQLVKLVDRLDNRLTEDITGETTQDEPLSKGFSPTTSKQPCSNLGSNIRV